MKLKKVLNPKIPLAISLLATTTGCFSPIPNYCRTREKHAELDMIHLQNNVCLPEHPLTLAEIIEIAVQRNLDVQLQRMEEAFQSQRVLAQKLRMLPDGTANADINNRDNNPGWFSRIVNLPGGPGPIGPTATQSTSKWVRLFDLTAAWNVIDLGLSYIRTQQETNRFLLTRQRNLRARQNLILDIYRAYYRAIVSQQAVDQSKVLIASLQRRQETLRQQIQEQIVSEMQGLVNENRLLDLQIKLYAFENEYKSAVTELSALMGLPPSPCLQLATAHFEDIEVEDISICEFEKMALRYRPELMAQEMQYVIDNEEVKASMIEMLPSARLFASIWHDDDMFIFNNDWFKFGTTLSWNLLQLPAKWANADSLDTRARVSWETRLSMSMGVITQVHLSYINIQESKVQYKLAKDLFNVKHRQLAVANVLERSGELSIDDVLVFEVESLFARVNAIKAYSNLQIALEQLGNSVGRPLLLTGGTELNALALGLENYCDWGDGLPMFDPSTIKRSPAEVFMVKEEDINREEHEEQEVEQLEERTEEQVEEKEEVKEEVPSESDDNNKSSDEDLEMLEKSYNSYIREHKSDMDKAENPSLEENAPSADTDLTTPSKSPDIDTLPNVLKKDLQTAPLRPIIPQTTPSLKHSERAIDVAPMPSLQTLQTAPVSNTLRTAPAKGDIPQGMSLRSNSDRTSPGLSQSIEKNERSVHGPQYVK